MPDKGPSPTELLRRPVAGSLDDLDQLLGHYRNYLAILARTHIGTTLQAKADPSDLVQDTLMEARRDFEQFRGSTEGEFVAWLRKMMANNGAKFVRHYKGVLARDVRREQRVQQELDRSTQMMARLVAAGSSPSERAVRAEDAVHLANALSELPGHYRDAIVLYHLQGRSIKDVAQGNGSHGGQYQEAAGQGADPTAIRIKGFTMTPSATADRPGFTSRAASSDRATQERIVEALAEYHGAVDAGNAPSRQAFLQRYPEIAQELAGFLDAFDFVRNVAPQLRDDEATGKIVFRHFIPCRSRRFPDPARDRPRRHGRRLRGRAALARPPRRAEGAAVRRDARQAAAQPLQERSPRRRARSTTRTSSPSTPSAASAASTTTPCSSSKARASPK